jgi:hypothetical protein
MLALAVACSLKSTRTAMLGRTKLVRAGISKLAAARIRGDDDDNNEAFRNWDKPIR